jgi:hypothetical protein
MASAILDPDPSPDSMTLADFKVPMRPDESMDPTVETLKELADLALASSVESYKDSFVPSCGYRHRPRD